MKLNDKQRKQLQGIKSRHRARVAKRQENIKRGYIKPHRRRTVHSDLNLALSIIDSLLRKKG